MTLLLPYLVIEHDDCEIEIVNNCRALAYARSTATGAATRPIYRPHQLWRPIEDDDCDHCCPDFDAGDYTWPGDFDGTAAPWAIEDVPASWEAFGFVPDLDGFEMDTELVSRGRPQFTLEGAIVASTRRGHLYMVRWLRQQLTACRRVTIRVADHCPDPDADPADTSVLPDWSGPSFLDRTDSTPVLLDEADLVVPDGEDTGVRTVFGVNLVSFDPLSDEFPTHSGGRYVAVFDAPNDRMIGRTMTESTLPVFDVSDVETGPAEPVTPTGGVTCSTCGVPCRCNVIAPSYAPVDEPVIPPRGFSPAIEPIPSCAADVECALAHGMVVQTDGFINMIASGIPTTGTFMWFPNEALNPDWLNRFFNYALCMNLYASSTDCGSAPAHPQNFVGCCTSVVGADRAEVVLNGTSGIEINPMNSALGSNANCNATLTGVTGFDGFATAAANGSAFADVDCIGGVTNVRPLVNTLYESGNVSYWAGIQQNQMIPWPMIYKGVEYEDGEAFAAALAAERGYTVNWFDSDDPAYPETYSIPNDQPRQAIPNLEFPRVYIEPMVDGVAGAAVNWPLWYQGVEFSNGDDLATYLSAVRNCLVLWHDDTDPDHPNTYSLTSPYDILNEFWTRTKGILAGCEPGEVVNLLTDPGGDPGPCFSWPAQIVRQAELIPAGPEGVRRALRVTVDNDTLPIDNLRVAVYDFKTDLPHILNQPEGAPQYWTLQPVAEWLVSGIPADSLLDIDGRTKTIELECLDGQKRPAGTSVRSVDDKPAIVPDLDCGAYWLEVSLSADDGTLAPKEYGGLDQTVAFSVHEVVQ